ncbi:CYTH domain-containing protein [Shinella daejeonensis]|uniref:CYTH domain-containing protein n=1 Tax=Shinella daejeonensis TaxID=659017 RepID=UPI0020C7588D|nr:CYTH domain-containing protein [Shinella daejeonensis]MCP8896116.1 CYTH domain-containing protein [Shinella daejeonensis]
MAKEIERKFLLSGPRWRALSDQGITIRQAYVIAQDDRSLRVRLYGDGRAHLTLKVGNAALVRDEYEFEIDRGEAEDMVRHAVGTVIEKVRYRISHEGHLWEVDVYDGVHRGLVIAEVELASIHDKPVLPDWVGREVTGDNRYSNQALALGFSDGARLFRLT